MRAGRLRAVLLACAIVLVAGRGHAGEGDPVLVLEAPVDLPARVPAGTPTRFLLFEDGRVFTGGTDRVYAGRLDKAQVEALLARAAEVRKLPGLGAAVAFSAAATPRFRLRILKGQPLDVVATGDPEGAPPKLKPLATFVADLLGFHHPSLRPFAAEAYALSAREETLPGGCRPWTLPVPLPEALAGPRAVPASAAAGWPKGANPTSVCAGDRRYVVTLRPLLPGEQP